MCEVLALEWEVEHRVLPVRGPLVISAHDRSAQQEEGRKAEKETGKRTGKSGRTRASRLRSRRPARVNGDNGNGLTVEGAEGDPLRCFPQLTNPYQQREEVLPIRAFRSTLLSQQLIACHNINYTKASIQIRLPSIPGNRINLARNVRVLHPTLTRSVCKRGRQCVCTKGPEIHKTVRASSALMMYGCVV